MSSNWDSTVDERYLILVENEMRAASITLCFLAVLLIPLYGIVDFYTQRSIFAELSAVRFISSVLFAFIYILMKRGHFQSRPTLTSMCVLTIASITVTLLCIIGGGFRSPYYAGILLVQVAAVLILPGGPKRLGYATGIILSTYFGGILLAFPEAPDMVHFINNLSFLLSTGAIGLAASLLTDKLRKQSFLRFLELEQTKKLLQGELIGHQGNIEALTRQLIDRRIELDEALRLRDEFISLASHELKTPLTSLKLQTEVSRRLFQGQGVSNARPFDPNRLLNTYESQIKRLTRIVDDMLDISRIKKGKFELELSPVDLRVLVEDVVGRFIDGFSDKGIQVSIHSEEAVLGTWDPYRLEQVILNLITNAIKYGQGRPVDIHVMREGSQAIISVRDQGIGIPLESQQKIFNRFERAVSFREFSGLGLGLYISRIIVEAHGGTIGVTSEPGAGSTFVIRLPIEENVLFPGST